MNIPQPDSGPDSNINSPYCVYVDENLFKANTFFKSILSLRYDYIFEIYVKFCVI
jgi:hypothetical protein